MKVEEKSYEKINNIICINNFIWWRNIYSQAGCIYEELELLKDEGPAI